MQRMLVPELLDLLPAHDARALRSRRDLRRINRCMGNHRWWRRHVARQIGPHERVLELGAGDGSLPLLPAHRVDGLDRMPVPATWPRDARWFRTPVQTFAGWSDYPVIAGNLVFHHFPADELRELGARVMAHTRLIAACEPRRARRYQLGFMVLAGILGACEVTRRDGHVSIAAGFRGDELPRALGLEDSQWQWTITETWLGAYRMIARRRT